MAIILSIDTATTVCSLALHKDGILQATQSIHLEKSHAALLTLLIEDTLSYCSLTIQDLDAIAISEGPGSYTGLRIGTATAKGLCFAHELPLITVNTLEAMAHGMIRYNTQRALLCPMLDARRMEVYCALFDVEGVRTLDTEAKIIDENAFYEVLASSKVLFFGDGANKCEKVIRNENAIFILDIHPSAVHIGELATQRFEEGKFEDLAYFEPFYLKDFRPTQAKQKLKV